MNNARNIINCIVSYNIWLMHLLLSALVKTVKQFHQCMDMDKIKLY